MESIVVCIGLLNKDDPETTIDFAEKVFLESGDATAVYLVDKAFIRVDKSELSDEIELIPDVPTRVFAHQLRDPPLGGTPPFQANMYVSPYTGKMSELFRRSNSSVKVTCVCFDSEICDNTFELASLVCAQTFENTLWFVADPSVKTTLETVKPHRIPDFVNSPFPETVEILKSLPVREFEGFRELLMQGIDILRVFIKCGYHRRDVYDAITQDLSTKVTSAEDAKVFATLTSAQATSAPAEVSSLGRVARTYSPEDLEAAYLPKIVHDFEYRENVAPPPGWAIQITGAWTSLMIGLNVIIPNSRDRTHREDLLITFGMRSMLVDVTVYALSNMMAAFSIVTEDDLLKAIDGVSKRERASHGAAFKDSDNHVAWLQGSLWDVVRSRVPKMLTQASL